MSLSPQHHSSPSTSLSSSLLARETFAGSKEEEHQDNYHHSKSRGRSNASISSTTSPSSPSKSIGFDSVSHIKQRFNILESDSPSGASMENVLANLKIADAEGNLPLHLLFLTKTMSVHEIFDAAQDIILKYPNSLTAGNKYGLMPIHLAAYRGVVRIMRVMLNIYPGAAAVPSNDGFYPLHMAAMGGCSNVCEYLYHFCEDAIHMKTKKGLLPENLASKYGFEETKSFLMKLRYKTPTPMPHIPGKEEVEKQLASFYSISEDYDNESNNKCGISSSLKITSTNLVNPNDSPTSKRNNLIWSQFKNKAKVDRRNKIEFHNKISMLENQSNSILIDVAKSKLLEEIPLPLIPSHNSTGIDDSGAETDSSVGSLFDKYRRIPTVQNLSEHARASIGRGSNHPFANYHQGGASPPSKPYVPVYNTIGGLSIDSYGDDVDDLNTTSASIIPDYLHLFLNNLNSSSNCSFASGPAVGDIYKRSKFEAKLPEKKSKSQGGCALQDEQQASICASISDIMQVKKIRSASVSTSENDSAKVSLVEAVESSSATSAATATVARIAATTATATSTAGTTSNLQMDFLTIQSIDRGKTTISNSDTSVVTDTGSRTDNKLADTQESVETSLSPIISTSVNNNHRVAKKPLDRKLYVFNKSNNSSENLDLVYIEGKISEELDRNDDKNREYVSIPVSVTSSSSKTPAGTSSSSRGRRGPVSELKNQNQVSVVAYKNLDDFMRIATPIPPMDEIKRSEKIASPRSSSERKKFARNISALSNPPIGGREQQSPPHYQAKLLAPTNYTFNTIPNILVVDGSLYNKRINNASSPIHVPSSGGCGSDDFSALTVSANILNANIQSEKIIKIPDIYTDSHIVINDSDDES